MPTWRGRARTAVSTLMAALLLLGVAVPAVVGTSLARVRSAAAAAACEAGWRLTQPPSLVGSTAVDVTYLGAAPWLAGSAVLEARRPSAFTAVGAGDAWTRVNVPATLENSVLTGITADGPRRLLAVGELVGAQTQPLVQRWDGASWTRDATSPLPNGGALTDVAVVRGGASLAVGYAADLLGQRPLAYVRRARAAGAGAGTAPGTWVDASPAVVDHAALTAISAASDGTTWAVGWVDTLAGLRPLLERWTGTGWERDTMRGIRISALSGVAVVSAHEAWAVGYRQDEGPMRALAIHWDGATWTVAPEIQIDGSDGSILRDVALVDGAPVAVGGTWTDRGDDTDPLVVRLDRGAWVVAPRVGGISGGELLAVAASAGGLVVVGRAGDRAMALTACSGTAHSSTAPAASSSAVSAPTSPTTATASSSARAAPLRANPTAPSATASAAPSATAVPFAASSTAAPLQQAAPGLEIRDLTTVSNLGGTTFTYSGNAADFDGDGWDDLVIGRHGRPLWVLRNTGNGTFVEPAPGGFRRVDRHGCSTGDLDGDGHPDIACALGANLGLSAKENEVWVDPFDPTASNRAGALGVTDPLGRGRRTAIFDANNDGRLDLYVANDPSRADGLPSSNHLFLNGASGFTSGRDAGLDLGVGGSCLVPVDLDADGWTDLVVCEYVQMAGYAAIHVFHNEFGHFVDRTRAFGIAQAGDIDAQAGDLDRDGHADLVRITNRRLEVDLQRGGTLNPAFSLAIRHAQTVTLADVNGDGFLDVFVQAGVRGGADQDVLLLNDGTGSGFTSVALPPAESGVEGGAIAIDYDHNGKQDLVVMHGNQLEIGPMQLLAFGPPWPLAPSPSPSPSQVQTTPPESQAPGTSPGPDRTPVASVTASSQPGASTPPVGGTGFVPDDARRTALIEGASLMMGSAALLAVLVPALRRRRRRLRS